MSLELQPYIGHDRIQEFNSGWMEKIVLLLGDMFDIRISVDRVTAIMTGVCAVAGALVGSYAGGRLGAALGAGIGSATGIGVSVMASLRELWETVKDKLQELLYIVFNYLRCLDAVDIAHAVEILVACRNSRRELVLTMIDFIAIKLGKEVISNLTAG